MKLYFVLITARGESSLLANAYAGPVVFRSEEEAILRIERIRATGVEYSIVELSPTRIDAVPEESVE